MPALVPLYVDSDAIESGAIYSNESTWAYATNEVSMSGEWVDVPNLTINLTLAQPATVLQIAQVDYRRGSDYSNFGIRLLRGGTVGGVPIYRRARYGAHWQNVFIMWSWAGTSAGSHTFKVQCSTGTIASRKHILIVMRI